ncbi:GntR family transcriptional regulator [Ideonella sp. YS5]|uniref:GntR family transcriptional regulator n=1 Tax=Ideonella sp. YS5 TaxID=3453714 RepID=UPI003EEE5908
MTLLTDSANDDSPSARGAGTLGASARDNPVPLHTQIREDLRSQITRGVFAPRQRLDSESQLMQRYGVSRITVRQALQTLEQQGLIVKVAGKGSFVAPERPSQDLTRLQGLAEAMAPQGHEIRNRVLAVRHESADATIAQRLGLALGERVVYLRRVRLVDGVPLSLDLTWLPAAQGELIARGDLVRRDVFVMLEQDLGITLGHADLSIDAVAAEAEVADELGVGPGEALLRIERLTHTASGRPIDWETLYCRADRYRWRLRLNRHLKGMA